MRHRKAKFSLVLLLLVLAQLAQAESLTPAEYRQQLHETQQKVNDLSDHPEKAGEIVTEIPDRVSVKTSTTEVSVNNKSLKDDLAAFAHADAQKRKELLPRIQQYVRDLSQASELYEKPATGEAEAQGKLGEVLSRPEFKKVRGPTTKDAFLARVYRWLSRLLDKLRIGSGSGFGFLRWMIYLLVGAAVTLLLVWTIRRLRRPQEDFPPREIMPFAPSSRSWRTWLAEARERALEKDWRSAIHLAYWAGISYLEEHGAWKPNRARTPREYLRLIGARATHYPTLAALTHKLEVIWYGYGSAAEADFQETLGQLEKLGCR